MRMGEAYRGPRGAPGRSLTRTVRSAPVALDPRTPVLVGVGQVTERPNPAVAVTDRAEPVDLMAEALRAAAADAAARPSGAGARAGRRLLETAPVVARHGPVELAVREPGPAGGASASGIAPPERAVTVIGGNNPQTVVSRTALQIASGELDVVLLTGAECIYTRVAARRDRGPPGAARGRPRPRAPRSRSCSGVDRVPVTDVEAAVGLDRPLRVFPLFENALRGAAGESIDEHQRRVSELWARFSVVAAGNPYAWRRTAQTPEELRTVGPTNRMVSFPYPKLMNANDRVDQGAALILCSVAAARATPACPRTGGCSPFRGPTRTTTGSSRIAPTCAPPPPSAWRARAPSRWPVPTSTT